MRDAKMENLIREEAKRQKGTLNLIPSENIVSPAVLRALGSPLTNKYSEGYPGKRYYAGNAVVDKIEFLAQERARKAFRLGKQWHVNVQPYSGSPANLAVYVALLKPGETIMGLGLPFGGHLTHGWRANISGQLYRGVQYGVGRDGLLDYEAIRKLARKERPRIIVAGATAYPRKIDFRKFGRIAREAGAYFLADIAHVAGLIIAGVHPTPFSAGGGQAPADIVMTTTHKTLRGPRGAIIFVNRDSKIAARRKIDIAQAIDRAVFPGLQGGPHDHQTAAIAVALGEALESSFRAYGRAVVKNARALAHELMRLGFTLVTGGTDNHLMLVDLTGAGLSGREAQDRLERSGIIVNRNAIPYDTRAPFDPSGIRIGTPALTSRGMREREMKTVARLISDVLQKGKNVRREATALAKRF
ncbi:MAG: serine hydroxymethyltransferase [Candidatus Liptonbacteria bacterium RIFCSPLOWO2_01_FULL_56_20]|uniref:Serine hydroxymethyltransferase n=1 Tax=Candidatus Liptonbacteria bacterium RIFCSPLOWO2_01_FULL_56_20 TaxID=1798652 RepID=A0A1G2CIC7_9BACT|nr:MAG: serine hydroxymethyltransferase [Candidatus Liptonbacteria bacterium RIFCSPHIGHO2_01_FULL_56_18b]OGZ01149.1 MAG: serine hydroxymethyltransferase [Candidatus Liptonbacteria bacterium RIFCSPLOWO2_01_FULL_56_20]